MFKQRFAYLWSTIVIAVAILCSKNTVSAINYGLTGFETSSLDSTAEIVVFTPDENTVISTIAGDDGHGALLFTLNSNGSLTQRGIADFTNAFGTRGDISGSSSVAADPLGRGFGATTLIPDDNGSTAGKIGFFDYRTATADAARNLNLLDVGFHPDSVIFTPDGSKVIVVNEGEFTTGGATDAPGSVSIIDLSSVSGIGDIGSLGASEVTTIDFTALNLGAGVSIAGLRINEADPAESLTVNPDALANPHLHIEPEFATVQGDKVFVSLQEANAVAVLDLTTQKWEAIHDLGTITQLVDASDRDSGFEVNDLVKGMLMPDTIASYVVNGNTFIVTANEGDLHVNDLDRIRIKDIDRADIDDATEIALDAIYGGNFQADDALGRLRVSSVDGDTDGDGDYDEFIMPGTRSFSIFDDDGNLVFDSGSLESLVHGFDPLFHNIDDGDPGEIDNRSDDKGPEPEALALGEIDGEIFAFVGLERQNGIVIYNITDPQNPFFVDYLNSLNAGLISPESIFFISKDDSPLRRPTFITGYEVSGSIGIYTIVPEPTTICLMALAAAGLLRRRRCPITH